jgi:hypothetical protein
MDFERRVSRFAASLDYRPQRVRQPQHEERGARMVEWSIQ